MNYGELMKDIRFENDITQQEMANILGIARSTYNIYEQQYVIIPLKYLIKFCNYFHIAIDYLFELSNKKDCLQLTNDIDLKLTGIKLRKIRKENHLTQIELANKLNIVNTIISYYERGRLLISTATLYSISKLLNVSSDYLLNRSDIKEINKECLKI